MLAMRTHHQSGRLQFNLERRALQGKQKIIVHNRTDELVLVFATELLSDFLEYDTPASQNVSPTHKHLQAQAISPLSNLVRNASNFQAPEEKTVCSSIYLPPISQAKIMLVTQIN